MGEEAKGAKCCWDARVGCKHLLIGSSSSLCARGMQHRPSFLDAGSSLLLQMAHLVERRHSLLQLPGVDICSAGEQHRHYQRSGGDAL